jgi:hypothetical protein
MAPTEFRLKKRYSISAASVRPETGKDRKEHQNTIHISSDFGGAIRNAAEQAFADPDCGSCPGICRFVPVYPAPRALGLVDFRARMYPAGNSYPGDPVCGRLSNSLGQKT